MQLITTEGPLGSQVLKERAKSMKSHSMPMTKQKRGTRTKNLTSNALTAKKSGTKRWIVGTRVVAKKAKV